MTVWSTKFKGLKNYYIRQKIPKWKLIEQGLKYTLSGQKISVVVA